MQPELEVLVEQLDELLASPVVIEDDALEVAIVAGLAYRLGAADADLAAVVAWREGPGADLLGSMWEQVDLDPLIEEVDDCTGGGKSEDEVEEAVYDVDDVVAAAVWCDRKAFVRSACRELASLIRGVPDVFTSMSGTASELAASGKVAENLGIYDYWLALADAARSAASED